LVIDQQTVVQQWLKEPTQARSKDTLGRILVAAEDLIAAGQFDRATVAGVVKRAGTSVGAFYARFSDKDALLHVLQERMVRRVETAVLGLTAEDLWEGQPLAEVVHGIVAGLACMLRLERSAFMALTAGWRVAGRPEVWDRSKRISRLIWDSVEALLVDRGDEIAHPRPEFAIRIGLSMVVWTLREHLVFGAAGVTPVRVSDDDLVAELATAYLSYLQGCAADTKSSA
jgi:AcrR family transcriptional regulator